MKLPQCLAAMAAHGLENYDLAEARKHAAQAYADIQARLQAKRDGNYEQTGENDGSGEDGADDEE